MNKLFTKIAALCLGATMAVGVGVAVASSSKVTPASAGDGDTHSFTDVAFSKLLNNNASIDSVTIAEQSYTVKKITTNVRYNKTVGGVTISPVIGTTPLESKTFNKSATEDLVWDIDPATKGAITFNFTNNCGSGTGKGTFYFNSVTLTEGSDSSKIETTTSITVPGGKTTLDYTANPADNVQLTAVVSYSGGSVPGSSVTWASSNPSVATVANGLVTAAGKGTTTITASYAGNTTYNSSMDQVDIDVIDPNETVFNFANLAAQYSWVNGTAYTPVVVNNVSLSTASGGNNAKYYSSDSTWRMYSGGSLSITAPSGKYITAVSSNPVYSFSIAGDAQSATASFASNVSFKEITVSLTTTQPTVLYTVSYNANLVGYTGSVPSSTTQASKGAAVEIAAALSSDGYTFDGWNTAADGSGTDVTPGATDYVPTSSITLYGQWTAVPSGDLSLTFDVSSNPGGWPTDNSSTLTDYTYTLNNVAYTFSLKNVKCNSGYLMCTSVAVLGLPAISGYKLTKVVANNSSGCSTSTSVGISSSDSQAIYVTGGSAQTWSTTSSAYTYILSNTEEDTQYFMYITNKNAQILSLTLSYEEEETPGTKVQLAAEGFSMDVGQSDVAPVVTNADTHDVITGCHFESDDQTVASIISGKVHAVAKGTAIITVTHDPDTANSIVYKPTTFTVTVNKDDCIEDLYSYASGTTVNFNGYYAGEYADGIVLMDGAYGMLIYKAASEEGWVVDETIINVQGSTKLYNGLIEIDQGSTVTKLTGAAAEAAAAKLSKPQNQDLTLITPSSAPANVANRRTYVAGTLKSCTASGSNYNITVTVNSTDVALYLKAADDVEVTVSTGTMKISAYLLSQVDKQVTIKGFTSFYSSGFQVRVYDILESSSTYTASDFAQDVLDDTDKVCSSAVEPYDYKTALQPIWNALEEKWNTLSPTEQAEWQNTTKYTPNYDNDSEEVIENGLGRYNYLCKKYTFSNFTHRSDVDGAPVASRHITTLLGDNNSGITTMIVVLASVVGVSAIGGYFFLRKRKEN